MTPTRPRWFTDHPDDHSRRYVERFRRLARTGADLEGEARFVHALVSPGSRILDAGCGPGRTGAALQRWGHHVTGVDVDPTLVAAAREDHPDVEWVVADLAELDLDELDLDGEPFDAAVLAGNVMVFLTPGRERDVLGRITALVRDGGVIVTGFALDRAYSLADFDDDTDAVGLHREHRFAGWDLAPWRDDADWAVTVLRR